MRNPLVDPRKGDRFVVRYTPDKRHVEVAYAEQGTVVLAVVGGKYEGSMRLDEFKKWAVKMGVVVEKHSG